MARSAASYAVRRASQSALSSVALAKEEGLLHTAKPFFIFFALPDVLRIVLVVVRPVRLV